MLSRAEYKTIGNAFLVAGILVVILSVTTFGTRRPKPNYLGTVVATEQLIFSGDIVEAPADENALLQFSNDTHLVLKAGGRVKLVRTASGDVEATLLQGAVAESSPEIAVVSIEKPIEIAPPRRGRPALAFPGLAPLPDLRPNPEEKQQ